MSTKVKCVKCGKLLDTRGVQGHMKFAHFSGNSEKLSEISGNISEVSKVSEIPEKVSQVSETAVAQLAEKESALAHLREEVIAKEAENNASKALISELEAQLAEIPKSVRDFPDDELNAYVNEAWEDASDEKKAKLAEQWGIKLAPLEPLLVPPPAPAEVPLAEELVDWLYTCENTPGCIQRGDTILADLAKAVHRNIEISVTKPHAEADVEIVKSEPKPVVRVKLTLGGKTVGYLKK